MVSEPTFENYKVENARRSVISTARALLDSPYLYSGSNPSGFDCSGYTKYVYEQSINKKIDHSSYAQSKLGDKIKIKDCKPGDLIFFKKNGKINHVGIIEKSSKGVLWVLHATSSRGVIREDVLKSPYWQNKIAFCRSLF